MGGKPTLFCTAHPQEIDALLLNVHGLLPLKFRDFTSNGSKRRRTPPHGFRFSRAGISIQGALGDALQDCRKPEKTERQINVQFRYVGPASPPAVLLEVHRLGRYSERV